MELDTQGKKIWLPKWLNIPMWFKNKDEDTVDKDGNLAPPIDYEPGNPHRLLHWRIRNPLHNFSHYVVGVADKIDQYDVKAVGPESLPQTWKDSGWNKTVLVKKEGNGIKLPFISYNGKYQFYAGWQPNTGKFGFALRKTDSTPTI